MQLVPRRTTSRPLRTAPSAPARRAAAARLTERGRVRARPPRAPAAAPVDRMRRIRPIRPRRPRARSRQLQIQLIVVLGGLAVVIAILWVAWQGFQKNNAPAPGAGRRARRRSSRPRTWLATELDPGDSTNINAQIALANVLYDTGQLARGDRPLQDRAAARSRRA